MYGRNELSVYIFRDAIIVKNRNGKEKKFPRCGITNVEMFVTEMANTGNLDDLA